MTLNGPSLAKATVAELLAVVITKSRMSDSRKAFVWSWICVVDPAASVTFWSAIVARVDPRVNGIAAAAAGCELIGERPRLAGAGAVPGAPIPVEVGIMVISTSLLRRGSSTLVRSGFRGIGKRGP